MFWSVLSHLSYLSGPFFVKEFVGGQTLAVRLEVRFLRAKPNKI